VTNRCIVLIAPAASFSNKKAPARHRGLVSVQADQNLTASSGFADHAFELRDLPSGFTWRTVHQLRQASPARKRAAKGLRWRPLGAVTRLGVSRASAHCVYAPLSIATAS